jgi:hypothetical protein
LTATTAGNYLIFAHIQFQWEGPPTGQRMMYFTLNGTTQIARISYPAVTDTNAQTYMSLSTHYKLSATDYVEVAVKHSQGAALDVLSRPNVADSPEFGMVKLP